MDQTTLTLIISLGGSFLIALASFGSALIIGRSKASREYADDLSKQLVLVRLQLGDMQKKHDECILELKRQRDENLDLMRRVLAMGA